MVNRTKNRTKAAPRKPRLPWQRQPKETAKSWEAFRLYRDMGEGRTLAKVAAQLGKSEAIVSRWSGNHGWVARAAAWDDHVDEQRRDVAVREARKMAERHALISQGITRKVADWLQGLSKEDVEKWSVRDASRALEIAVKIERLSRGEATDRTESINTDVRNEDVREMLQDEQAVAMANELLLKIANAGNQ